MARLSLRTALLAPALALMALSGCATGFRADVSRFQQMPVPQGQSFTIVADDPALAGGIEFSQYAGHVAQHLSTLGYRQSNDPAAAELIVRMRYDIDNGRERVRSTGYYAPDFYYPYYRGYWTGRYGRGYYDPFLFGMGQPVLESYTVYTSTLKLQISKTDGTRLFEGNASAQSLSNKQTYLVPNLIDAMFTGFPGTSGETIKITVPPEPKK